VLNRTLDCSQAQTGFACVQGKSTGLSTVADGEEMLVAEACNHPNCLVLRFRFAMIHVALKQTTSNDSAEKRLAVNLSSRDELLPQEVADIVKRFLSGAQSEVGGENMGHPFPGIDLDGPAPAFESLTVPKRVIEKYFVFAYVNFNSW
jgi:hypothetical protein